MSCGLVALANRRPSAVLVTLGDAPLVTAAAVARFAVEPPPARAVYDGRPGHPVVLGSFEIASLADNSGDRGARDVLRGVRTIETGWLCCGRDVDTLTDLERLRHKAGFG